MKLLKLSDNNTHIDAIVQAMCERHLKLYGTIVCNNQTKQYCIAYTYAMVDDRNNLIGFASISRINISHENLFVMILSLIVSFLMRCIYIYDVYIFPPYRGQGNGKNLVALAINEIATKYNFVRDIYLHCKPKLTGFYGINGFELSKLMYFNNERLVLMKHRLE